MREYERQAHITWSFFKTYYLVFTDNLGSLKPCIRRFLSVLRGQYFLETTHFSSKWPLHFASLKWQMQSASVSKAEHCGEDENVLVEISILYIQYYSLHYKYYIVSYGQI